MTDDFADKEGLEMGDEYFANLDHIESVENFKEGYESEAHCSDSEGSGVDLSRIKIQPSALVSANSAGRQHRKGERSSCHFMFLVLQVIFFFSFSFIYFLSQTKAQAHPATAMKMMTKTLRVKMKATVQTTRL